LKCGGQYSNNQKYKNYIKRWLDGKENGMKGKESVSGYIKRWLREKYGNKCSKCGWHEINPYTGNVPLEAEHIDGNFKNNRPENLDLLCPNCHSLTKTYGSLNKGHGRRLNGYCYKYNGREHDRS
jgi:hypothetical protein